MIKARSIARHSQPISQVNMNIILHQIDSIAVGIDKKDGYLNATKLCTAYNNQKGTHKQPSDWTKTKAAKEYIAYVSSVRNIVRTELIVVRQGGIDEQGTWIHPDLGTAFSAWLSVEYQFAVSEWVQEWRSGKISKEFPNQIVGNEPINPAAEYTQKLKSVVGIIFAEVEPEFRQGILIEGVCKKHPELREALEPHKPKLLLESPLLSPTDIGKLLEAKDGIKRSGQAINKLLIEHNLQVATNDKKLAYKAIGQGIEFSKVVADTAAGHGKTIQSLRWYESVLDLI